jgi:uncharacterized OB-fold protein
MIYMAIPRFWREIPSRYNLIGTQCGNCQKRYFPPRLICPQCHRKSVGKMMNVNFEGTGEVITYSIIHNAPSAYEMMLPYVIAIIELEEGVRATGQIINCEPEDVSVGMKVKPAFRKIGEDGKQGVIYYGYKFKPV